ncbi:hypothetical protein HDU87_008437 [Geranomyces variabilis]|uniref:Ankyrin repeat protein n=1 Tax=Geranomyces variabilis TaxID=109894 RepID=A0AAD5XJR5_9FUNG|nr:hypothetical protein HDU87_008437 [Geranomyces variabilis]
MTITITPNIGAKLSTLPPELLARIFVLLPNPMPISQTARWERAVTTAPPVQLAWARGFMFNYHNSWESITNDAAVWGPPPSSHGYGETTAQRPSASDGGDAIIPAAVLATPGMLAACIAACPLPIDSAKIAARVFIAACAWDAVDVVRRMMEMWKADDALMREMAEQGIQFAARSGAQKVVAFLRDAGYGVVVVATTCTAAAAAAASDEATDVVGIWCAELQEALADWRAEGRMDVAGLRRRHAVIEALLNSIRPAGTNVATAAARMLCASIGDAGAMRICLTRLGVRVPHDQNDIAGIYTTAVLEMRKTLLLLPQQHHAPSSTTTLASEINAALALCALLSDDQAAVQTAARSLPTSALIQLLRHCVAPPAAPQSPNMIPFLLDSIPHNHLPGQLRHLLELVLLTSRADVLSWIAATLPLGDRTAYPGVSAALTTAVLHTGGPRRKPAHVVTVRTALDMLAAAGADVAACGTTALIHAARLGDIWAVRWLLEHGVDARSRAGTVALTHASAGVNGAEVTQMLLAAGASRNPS